MTQVGRIALVSNPEAGKGRALGIQEWLCAKLAMTGLPFQLFTPPWPSPLGQFSAVWLIGGEGTLFHFFNQYPAIDLPIALFGGGSGNDFVWKLAGRRDPEECFAAAMAGKTHLVDAGICNGNIFVNGMGIGFDGAVVKGMLRRKRLLRGHAAYFMAVIREIFRFREKEMELVFEDGRQWRSRFFMVAIANGSRYGGGFLIAPQALVDDGLLDMVCIRPISLLKRLFYLPKVEKGKHMDLPIVGCSRLRSIVISSPQLLSAHLDGEYMEDTRFEISVRPARFRFIY